MCRHLSDFATVVVGYQRKELFLITTCFRSYFPGITVFGIE